MPMFNTLNLNLPYKFVKLTILEVRIQTVQILTQGWSCPLNGSSGAVPTHSLACMCTQWVFRGCLILTHWHSHALKSVQGVFNIQSLAFMHTYKRLGWDQF